MASVSKIRSALEIIRKTGNNLTELEIDQVLLILDKALNRMILNSSDTKG